MGERQARRELATRLAGAMKHGNIVPQLQFLCDGNPLTDGKIAEIWTGPFSSLRDDIIGFDDPKQANGRRHIGIWEEEESTGDFVRSRRHVDLWRFCANVGRIKRKGKCKRVLFLGESVARGFFFSPLYGPAAVLEKQLSSLGEPIEVVDLAQSNCGSWWLTQMAQSASILEPDAIVVFAGNNWRVGALGSHSAETFVEDGELLTTDRGLAKLMEHQRQAAGELAEATVRRLSFIAAKAGAPLIFVIPELNLADWVSCPINSLDVPLMGDEDTRLWRTTYSRARNALANGGFAEAEALARKLIELDGSASSASLELLGFALRAQGKELQAGPPLRQSRDVVDETRVLPGIFSIVADTIRRMCAKTGDTVVDLPRIFADHYAGELPGRRQFLDYCHLNAEGIKVSMAATAKAVAQRVLAKGTELPDLVAAAPSPTGEQEGWAHMLAGVHNAHWGQGEEICRHHFERAVEAHPPIRAFVAKIYDVFRHGVASPLVEPFESLVKNEIASTYLMGYGLIGRGLISEHTLTTSLIAAFPDLDAISPDPDFTLGEVCEIDLLHPHWSELMDGNRWHRRSFAAAYELESAFPFVCASSRDLRIALTCRIPGACEPGNVVVELNGREVGRLVALNEWRSAEFAIGEEATKAGFNTLMLRWPDVSRADMRHRLRQDFEAGRQLDTHTHFGQVHELTVDASGSANPVLG